MADFLTIVSAITKELAVTVRNIRHGKKEEHQRDRDMLCYVICCHYPELHKECAKWLNCRNVDVIINSRHAHEVIKRSGKYKSILANIRAALGLTCPVVKMEMSYDDMITKRLFGFVYTKHEKKRHMRILQESTDFFQKHVS